MDFFLESHAKGLDSFRDIAAGPCGLGGGGGAPQVAVEDEAELGMAVEARLGILGRDAETEDLLRERSELFELFCRDRPLASPSSFSSLSWTSSNLDTLRAVRSGDPLPPSSLVFWFLGLIVSSSIFVCCSLDIDPGILDTRGVVLSDEEERRRSDDRFEGRRFTEVEDDESRRSVNDRTEVAADERSVNDRAEAFDLVLLCWGRGRGTISVASSKVSYLSISAILRW